MSNVRDVPNPATEPTAGTRNPEGESSVETEMFLTNWPLRDESPGSWILAALCFLVPLTMGILCDNLTVGAFGVVAICLVFWRLFTPVSFLLGPNGIEETALGRSRKSSWRHYATFMRKPNGVLLVPATKDGSPPVMRGTYIFAGSRQERLVELLGRNLTETSEQSVSEQSASAKAASEPMELGQAGVGPTESGEAESRQTESGPVEPKQKSVE